MQLTAHDEIARAQRAAGMVVRRQRVDCRVQLNVECLEDAFNVALEIIEIEFAFGLVNALCAKRAGSCHDQRTAFAIVPIDFAELKQLQVANAAIDIPLNRVEDARHE